ncbi:MAG: bacillithiol system redox-active protein YtxJ [Cellulophaga sp.]
MGFFNKMFTSNTSAKKEAKVLPWIPLTSVAQLSSIKEKSSSKPQIIFKHSTTCGISRMVSKMFVDAYDFSTEQFDLYYLDLLSFREVSNETGYVFQIEHQSPQLLVIKNGVVVAHASHGAIADIDLNKFN